MPSKLRCSICSEAYTNSDDIYTTFCGHIYHFDCLQRWKAESTSCPECRAHNPTTHKIYLNFEPDNGDDEKVKELNHKLVTLKSHCNDLEAKLTGSEIELNDQEMKGLENIRHLALQNDGPIAKHNGMYKHHQQQQQQRCQHHHHALQPSNNFMRNMENGRSFNHNFIPVQAIICASEFLSIMMERDCIMQMVANEYGYGGCHCNGGYGAPPQPRNYHPSIRNFRSLCCNCQNMLSRPSCRNSYYMSNMSNFYYMWH